MMYLIIVSLTLLASLILSRGGPAFEDFVGSEAGAKCHEKQYKLWKESTHGRAGGDPREVKIIARFDGQPMRFKDASVTPRVNTQGEYQFVGEEPGLPPLVIGVDNVIGSGQMYGGGTQFFFHKFNDGTVRFLPFDFIRKENLWFVQLRRDLTWVPLNDQISLRTDLANWPAGRVLGTVSDFSNCQNCHGSQIATQFDPNTRKYQTHYTSLAINCESCHGPGKAHIQIVSRPGFERMADLGMKPLATVDKDQSLMICFQCHATKEVIREGAYLPGDSLEDFFSIKFPQFENTYTPDGRVRSFGYQGNHLYSDCYLNGSMSCGDCHDPHPQQYRDVFGRPLAGRFDNRSCTSCHASKGVSPEAHTHHAPGSAGSLCTSCHMPFLQHSGVGPHLRFARSDHSIPIPRPAFDQKLGIENACQKCHQEKDLAWQEAKVREWYGELKPHNPMVAQLLEAGRSGGSNTAAELLLAPPAAHPIAQASALINFLKEAVHPRTNAFAAPVLKRLQSLATNEDLDIRSLALAALYLGGGEKPGVRSFCEERLRELPAEDPVRNRCCVALSYLGDALAAKGDPGNAILCFDRALEVKPDAVITLSHRALACLRAGDVETALQSQRKAVALQPSRAVLHFQLALIYQQRQQIQEAIRELEIGLQYAPDDPRANQMLEQLRR